jgi:hypothetical protein
VCHEEKETRKGRLGGAERETMRREREEREGRR